LRTGEPSASITVMPAGKKTWCVVQSSAVTRAPGSKIIVRIA